jgi:hypothetical protein
MREVIPNILRIENAQDARDVKGVLACGIGVVIDLAIEEPPIQFPRDIVYCRFPLLDGEGNSPALLQSAIDTTATFVNAKQPTLVAYSGGMSRAPIIVSAVLAKIESHELHAAVSNVEIISDLKQTKWGLRAVVLDSDGRTVELVERAAR